MAYQIEYAYTCHMGKVRANNEDNFWCCGEHLMSENQGTEGILAGKTRQRDLPVLAVFDGMGGESCGEIAAYLAASTCGEFYQKNKNGIRKDPEIFLEQCCKDMNRAVCAYGEENKVRSMGSTAAMLAFARDSVYTCNLGDSRIYQSRNGQFVQLSTDHVIPGGLFGKAPLTQYVGVPEDYMTLEPSIEEADCSEGTRYLICSDGMTDMLSDGEIADILTREISVQEAVGILLDRALKKGGRDNVTIVLCEIKKHDKGLIGNWIEQVKQKYIGGA